ncbi:uncharacterized protein LOC121680274 [Alosa sapidissima]|uniref:uncharacterized protein LOC121680274 n=1 Tax=Alosa sapidissima TaxID=34773 RepID=UPI001C088D09|nr:uncharacterized protein LOC121680274 [Alosa sapidissima]
MESRGCFMDALRSLWASIRSKVSKRGTKQRRRNLRISKMQAMERMDRKWNRRLNKKVKSEKKSGYKTSKQDRGRARLVASGWKPRGEEGKPARSKVQKKMDITLQALQESRKPLKVQLRAQRPHYLGDMENVEKEKSNQDYKTDEGSQVQAEAPREMNCGHGDAKTFPEGKKGLHPEMAGYDPGMDTSRPGKHGEVLCSQRWQNMVLQGAPAIQDKTGTQSPACDGEEEPVEGREQEMSLAEQTELPVPVEMSTESSSPTLPELDNDDLEDEVQIENTEEGDVQGYLAKDEHLSPFVRLDGNNEASEDYTCVHYYYYRLISYFIILFWIIISLYFPH